ncbi:class II aldolase/adducin N-terminal [Aspergillus falconensis]
MAPSAIPTAQKITPSSSLKAEPQTMPSEDTESQLSELSFGPNALRGIPSFSSTKEHREHIALHMAAVFRNWARVGFTEGISGHISVRDPEHPNYIWMNPIGRHFALLNAGDMLCLDIDTGKIVGGCRTRPVNAPGFHIHSAIHKARPDIHAICHAHTMAGRAWTAFGKPLDMITQDVCDLYDSIALYNEYGGIVTAEQEGQQIARALGSKAKAALLLNHGLITVGSTVDEAAFLIGLLDRSCDIQLRVEAACAGNPGLKKQIIPDELARFNFAMAGEKNWLYAEAQPDIEYEIESAGPVIRSGLENIRIHAEE